MFEEHPLLGIGRENFKPELYRLAARKLTSPGIAELPHSHNGMLFQMALWGIGGLAALLLVYLVPLVYFFRELRHPDMRVRSYAAMGVTLCLGFWVFDLTDVMFFWVILNGFYAINLAVFLVCMDNCKADWSQPRQGERP
jgi:O-antigen ligase